MFSKYSKYLKRMGAKHFSTKGSSLKAGDKAVLEKTITTHDVRLFKELTGDCNPIHFRNEKPVVHGAFLNGLVSAVLGTKLPGPGTVLTDQTLKFVNPCYIGEKVTVTVEIVSVRKIIECSYQCSVAERVILSGTAKLVINDNIWHI